MDPGCAAILGALIGAVAVLAGNLLTHYLQTRRPNSLNDIRRKRLLRELQDPKYEWRSLERLSSVIGANEDHTIELLLEIGARTSKTDKNVWALESKKPYDEKAGD